MDPTYLQQATNAHQRSYTSKSAVAALYLVRLLINLNQPNAELMVSTNALKAIVNINKNAQFGDPLRKAAGQVGSRKEKKISSLIPKMSLEAHVVPSGPCHCLGSFKHEEAVQKAETNRERLQTDRPGWRGDDEKIEGNDKRPLSRIRKTYI